MNDPKARVGSEHTDSRSKRRPVIFRRQTETVHHTSIDSLMYRVFDTQIRSVDRRACRMAPFEARP